MELEYKYQVDEKIFKTIEKMKLPLIQKTHQIDTYFIVAKPLQNKNSYLRLRQDVQKQAYSLELCQVISDLATEETEVSLMPQDISSIHKIFNALGYFEEAVIDKQRTVYQMDTCHIVLDTVKELGLFVEIELISNNLKPGLKKITDIADRLGLTEEMRISLKGYPDLLLEQHA